MLGQPSFGLTRTLNCSFDAAVLRIRASLGANGFGVLSEIDLSATLKKKLDVEVRPYLILGACHPQSALDALQAEPAIGLLLPCNVVVTVNDAGDAVLGAIDPAAMFSVVQQPGMEALVADVTSRLQRSLDQA